MLQKTSLWVISVGTVITYMEGGGRMTQDNERGQAKPTKVICYSLCSQNPYTLPVSLVLSVCGCCALNYFATTRKYTDMQCFLGCNQTCFQLTTLKQTSASSTCTTLNLSPQIQRGPTCTHVTELPVVCVNSALVFQNVRRPQ